LSAARAGLKPLRAKAPDDITYNLAQIGLEITNNRLDEAEQRIERLRTSYPGNYPLKQARADLLVKLKRPAEAEKVLEDLLKSRSDDPDVWYDMAEVRGLSGNTIGLHQARAEYFALVGDFDQAIQQLDFAKRRAGDNFQLASRIDARQREMLEQERMVKDMMR